MPEQSPEQQRARVLAIYTAASRGAPMQCRTSVEAVAGRGLRGDRYHEGFGTFSGRSPVVAGGRALSLIDCPTLAVCRQRLGWEISAAALRRNMLVDGLDLLDLRGQQLRLGSATIEVLGRCPPCGYLSRLLGDDMRAALHGLGGVRARILSSGPVATGDPVAVLPVSKA
ncbi:MOSC domain-containing protein [Salinisphaera sp. SPP-AMP-43]|uniref:MOSC domain-containing protein n=1 Tax=Salinisphaera sp. SPP-AMP-43 TaxID=3121288 RepID=UPI003C6E114D